MSSTNLLDLSPTEMEELAQTLGALVPLLGYLNLPEPVLNVLEHGTKMLH